TARWMISARPANALGVPGFLPRCTRSARSRAAATGGGRVTGTPPCGIGGNRDGRGSAAASAAVNRRCLQLPIHATAIATAATRAPRVPLSYIDRSMEGGAIALAVVTPLNVVPTN